MYFGVLNAEEWRFLEFFAGRANTTFCLHHWGYPGCRLDKDYGGEYSNILSDSGMAVALLSLLKLTSDCLVILAPDCSSFSFLSVSGSQRYWWAPLGDESRDWVRRGNTMACRTLGKLRESFVNKWDLDVSSVWHLAFSLANSKKHIALRVVLLVWTAVALGHYFILEQPGSAKMGDLPRWQAFCQEICVVPCLN